MKPTIIDSKLKLIHPLRKDDVKRKSKRGKVLKIISLVFLYLFLIALAIIVIFPFYYMIVGSFMKEVDITNGKLLPQTGNLFENINYNYSQTVNRLNIGRYIGNSLLVVLATTIGMLIITIAAAFAFAKLKFKGRDLIFMILLATMMIPGEMMMISNYSTMITLNLIKTETTQTFSDAFLVMVLPHLVSVFYIYLLRENFKQIPDELYLAAKVDGMSDWKYMYKVMVPLASPTIITITILQIIYTWNSYAWPNLTVKNRTFAPLSVIIRDTSTLAIQVSADNLQVQYSWVMAASVITVLPLLVLFIVFRKYIMKRSSREGIKG